MTLRKLAKSRCTWGNSGHFTCFLKISNNQGDVIASAATDASTRADISRSTTQRRLWATSRPWPYRPEADVCISTGARTWITVAENGGNMVGTRVPLWTRAWPAAACGILLVAPFLQAWVLAEDCLAQIAGLRKMTPKRPGSTFAPISSRLISDKVLAPEGF